MFCIVQLPLADLRPLVDGQYGRLTVPDWTEDNLSAGFVRGFGKISPRNSSSLGLGGEAAFADCNNAVRFIEHIQHLQDGWNAPIKCYPWFRRLYFDGQVAGRFEFGFLSDEFHEGALDPKLLAKTILSTTFQVESLDGSKRLTNFTNCPQVLGHAYLTSTTRNSDLSAFPVAETFGKLVFVGAPTVHIRVSSGRELVADRDRRILNADGAPALFLTSPEGNGNRNSVLVQESKHEALQESGDERVTRVLFSHLNSLLHALSLLNKNKEILLATGERDLIREILTKTVERFNGFCAYEGSETDQKFVAGMKHFASAYMGRIEDMSDRLVAILEELDKPTITDGIGGYLRSLHDLVVTTFVKTVAESATK